MEGSEGALNRVGRAVWTVWHDNAPVHELHEDMLRYGVSGRTQVSCTEFCESKIQWKNFQKYGGYKTTFKCNGQGYITGAVGRYLRPDEEAQNVHHKQEDIVAISLRYKELKVKEEKESPEIKRSERKTREDLLYSGFSVRAAAVQWEKGNIAHDSHEVKFKSKHTYTSSEGVDKKSQLKKDDEKTLDDKSRLSKTYGNQFTEHDDSPAYSDADEKNQDRTFCGNEEAELNVESEVTNQEWTRKPEEKEKLVRIRNDESEAELIKIVEGSESGEKQRRKEEDEQERQTFRKEFEEPKKEVKCNFTEEDLPAKEAGLTFERGEIHQEQKRHEEEEEEDVETLVKMYNETKKESINSEFIDLGLLTQKAYLNVDKSKNEQEQSLKQEEKSVDVTMKRENGNSNEEPTAGESIDQGLTKKVDLNIECRDNNEEQGKKVEKEGVELMRRENKEPGENLIQNKLIEQSLMAKEAELNVEKDESRVGQKRKSQKEEEDVDETLRILKNLEDLISKKFPDQDIVAKEADLNVERSKSIQEQKRKNEEECVEIIREKDETGEEVTEDADLNVERSKTHQEPEKKAEDVVKIMKKENAETVKEPIISEFTDQNLLTKEGDLNVLRSNQDQNNKQQEEEGVVEQIKRENDKCVESIDQGLLTKKVDSNVKWTENSQKHIKKKEHEDVEVREPEEELIKRSLKKKADLRIEYNQEHTKKTGEGEECIADIIKKENDDVGEEPVKSEFTAQGLLDKETDLNIESDVNSQEQRRKQEQKEECTEIMKRENNESKKEPIQSEFIDQSLLAKEATLSVEKSETTQEPTKKVDEGEGVVKIMRTENDDLFKAEFIDHGLLTKETDLHEKRSKSNQEEIRKPDEKKKGVKIMRENDTTGEKPFKSEFRNQGLLKKEDDQEQKSKQEEDPAEIMRRENNESEDQGLLSIRNELNMEEQSNCATTAHENEASKSQTVDKALFIQLASTWGERDPFHQSPLNQSVQPLVEIPENATLQNITSEVTLNVDSRQLVDAAEKGSQKTAILTKQELEVVNTRPETETGNQTEAVETTSQFRAEVAAVDMKKSAKRDNRLHEQPVDREDVTVQEITDQCVPKQSFLKQSSDTRITELTSQETPFSEIKFLSLEQVEETAVVSLHAMQGSSVQKLDERSREAEMEAKLSSSEQTAEVFEMLSEVRGMSKQAQPKSKVSPVENTYDKLIVYETPLEDQINQNKFTVQYSAAEASSLSNASDLLELESEQKTLDSQTDSQKHTEEQERTVSADPGLLDEIKDVTPCLGFEEQITWISGLTKDSKDTNWELLREREASERKKGSTKKLESHKETSESNTDVKLQDAARDCEKELEAEMTDFEGIVVSTGWEMESVKKTEKVIHPEEERVGHGKSVMNIKEDMEERGRSRLKTGPEKISEDSDEDKPSVLTNLLLPSQASSLDFTVQKSKIAVKNPLIRPPKDPRTLINMASVEPLTPHPPHPSQSSLLKKSHLEGASAPGKGVIGFKFPGLDSSFPALRKTEAGRKMRDGEDSQSGTSQNSNSGLQSADEHVKQETLQSKLKWTPPRQPGMGSPLMMAELKHKLKKPAEE